MSTQISYKVHTGTVDSLKPSVNSVPSHHRLPLTPYDKSSPVYNDGNIVTCSESLPKCADKPRANVHDTQLQPPNGVSPLTTQVCRFTEAWTPPQTPVKKKDDAVMQSHKRQFKVSVQQHKSDRVRSCGKCDSRTCSCSGQQTSVCEPKPLSTIENESVNASTAVPQNSSMHKDKRRSTDADSPTPVHDNSVGKTTLDTDNCTSRSLSTDTSHKAHRIHSKNAGDKKSKKPVTKEALETSNDENAVGVPAKKPLTGRAAICAGRQSTAFDTLAIAVQDDVTSALIDTLRSFRRKLDIFAKRTNKAAQCVVYTHEDVDAAVLKVFGVSEKAARSGKLLQAMAPTNVLTKKHNTATLPADNPKHVKEPKRTEEIQACSHSANMRELEPTFSKQASLASQTATTVQNVATIQVNGPASASHGSNKIRTPTQQHSSFPPSETMSSVQHNNQVFRQDVQIPQHTSNMLLPSAYSASHTRDQNETLPAMLASDVSARVGRGGTPTYTWISHTQHRPEQRRGDLSSSKTAQPDRATMLASVASRARHSGSSTAMRPHTTMPSAKQKGSPNASRKRRHHATIEQRRTSGSSGANSESVFNAKSGVFNAKSGSVFNANSTTSASTSTDLLSPVTYRKHVDGGRGTRSRSGTPLLASSPFPEDEDSERLRVPTPEVMMAGVNDVLTAVGGSAVFDDGNDTAGPPHIGAITAKPPARSSLATTSYSYVGVGASTSRPGTGDSMSRDCHGASYNHAKQWVSGDAHDIGHNGNNTSASENDYLSAAGSVTNGLQALTNAASMGVSYSMSYASKAPVGCITPRPRRPSLTQPLECSEVLSTERSACTIESNGAASCSGDDDDNDVYNDMVAYKKQRIETASE